MLDRHGQIGRASPISGLAREAAQYWPLAGAMIFTRLGLATMDIVDGVMLAQKSGRQLVFYGLADAMAGRVLDVGLALMMAGLALAAQANEGSRDDQRQVGRIWQQALLLALLVGLASAALGLMGPLWPAALGQNDTLVKGSGSVLTILSLGILPGLLAMATAGLLQAVGRPGVVVAALLLANALKVVFNLTLIDAVSDGPAQAAAGVAWATVLVRWTLAVTLLAVAWWLPQQSRFGLRLAFRGRDWHASAEQRSAGWAAAGRAAVLALPPLVLVLMAGWRGERLLTVMVTIMLMLLPCLAVGRGLADAAGQRVTAVLDYAKKRPGSVSRCGERCTLLALAVLVLVVALYGLALPTLVQGLGLDVLVTRDVVQLVPLALTVVLAQSLALLSAESLRSLGEQQRPFVLQATIGMVCLPLAWVLGFELNGGVAGLLAAHGVAAALQAFVLGRQYRSAATALDDAAASAIQARANAIAHGYADTVLMRPISNEQAGRGRPTGAPRARAR